MRDSSSRCGYYFVVFFFKQKTAYEMRISDWSSDVCSSDLCLAQHGVALARAFVGPGEDIAQQFDSIELIHAEGALDVQVVRHVHERQRRQVVANQWNIGSQSRSTLVDVVERLQESEERRVGKGWVSTCRARWSPYH